MGKNGLSNCAISFTEQEVEICFAVADKDGDGEVSLSEFVDLLSTSTSSGDGPMAKFLKYCIGQAFRIMDADQDGSISFAELSISLRAAGFSDQEIQTVFALADHDRDGEVSLQELPSSPSFLRCDACSNQLFSNILQEFLNYICGVGA